MSSSPILTTSWCFSVVGLRSTAQLGTRVKISLVVCLLPVGIPNHVISFTNCLFPLALKVPLGEWLIR